MRVISQNEIVKEINEALRQPNRIVIVDYDAPQVNYGFDEKPNFEYCEEHNIPCVDIGRRGGAFVVNKGDIGLGAVMKGFTNEVGITVTDAFLKYLQDKGLNTEYKDNDILVDGYKVYGWASHFYKDYDCMFITCHFTMSVNLDLINSICTKPMNKIPKGLNDFGITANEVKEFITTLVDKI